MTRSRAFFGLPLLLLATAHCGGAPPTTKPAGERPLPIPPRQLNIGFQRVGITLDNGLKVLLVPELSSELTEIGRDWIRS